MLYVLPSLYFLFGLRYPQKENFIVPMFRQNNICSASSCVQPNGYLTLMMIRLDILCITEHFLETAVFVLRSIAIIVSSNGHNEYVHTYIFI